MLRLNYVRTVRVTKQVYFDGSINEYTEPILIINDRENLDLCRRLLMFSYETKAGSIGYYKD